jgi:RNA polymerase sigma-70 factor, ECF subfamily
MIRSSKLVAREEPEGAPVSGAKERDASGITEVRRGSSGVEVELVEALGEGRAWARRELLDRYGGDVERILVRILGSHPDLEDLALEVFVRAFERIGDLRERGALRGWLMGIAVFVAREAIRKRQRRRWLVFLPAEQTPDPEGPSSVPEARAALRAVYEVVGRLDPDVGIAFALRFIEGMELAEIAQIAGVSLATVKRRLKRAEVEFAARGRAHEALVDWFEEGTRWPLPED